ncbi:MAG: zinc ribbon domain-containing protein [Chloroflexi bacterium]|nr:zinc ribbon domain-containing protein [Chloroflexota bacterium]MDA1218423.1 zinc ribbon domain-containing protein [Chloroflexota bacterium]PKB57428.1 MAG: hypothetical protein BZY73_03255 [SAR202 cluster bacterium Casp-Chloro-G3]
MSQSQLQGTSCQSCSMPMAQAIDGDFGTNADGSKNPEYCAYCYQKGDFTDPSMTLEEMIETASKGWSDQDPDVSYVQALVVVKETVPTLKRWR